jgi:hypothetical protein
MLERSGKEINHRERERHVCLEKSTIKRERETRLSGEINHRERETRLSGVRAPTG